MKLPVNQNPLRYTSIYINAWQYLKFLIGNIMISSYFFPFQEFSKYANSTKKKRKNENKPLGGLRLVLMNSH